MNLCVTGLCIIGCIDSYQKADENMTRMTRMACEARKLGSSSWRVKPENSARAPRSVSCSTENLNNVKI